jgi:hypothetical protein
MISVPIDIYLLGVLNIELVKGSHPFTDTLEDRRSTMTGGELARQIAGPNGSVEWERWRFVWWSGTIELVDVMATTMRTTPRGTSERILLAFDCPWACVVTRVRFVRVSDEKGIYTVVGYDIDELARFLSKEENRSLSYREAVESWLKLWGEKQRGPRS